MAGAGRDESELEMLDVDTGVICTTHATEILLSYQCTLHNDLELGTLKMCMAFSVHMTDKGFIVHCLISASHQHTCPPRESSSGSSKQLTPVVSCHVTDAALR